jgi:hypothetical protein
MGVGFDTFVIYTGTDSNGHFSVPHNLALVGPRFEIDGITVAVQHTQNQNWYALEQSNAGDNRFWWNDTLVAGSFGSFNFHNSFVRIIVFAQFHQGPLP